MNKLYSSFSQTKGLLWREWFDGILNEKLLPPPGAVIDLTDACNLNCYWCNAKFFRSPNVLETAYVKLIVDDLADWGVKSVCYAGGGEPTLHKDYGEIIRYSAEKGLEVGLSTNGVLLTPEWCRIIADNARFCGFSVDAGTPYIWTMLKGVHSDFYFRMKKNARMLGEMASKTALDFTYKFMLVPENQCEVYEACRKAKRWGFKNFFVRPAAFENVPNLKGLTFNVDVIKVQLEKCLELETDTFKVYSSFGRVGNRFERIIPFKKCLATPLIAVYCADGWCYLCIDKREHLKSRLCKHLELRKYWGSKEHLEKIRNIDLTKCPRCAFAHYNQQLEAYTVDYMFRWFP